MRATAQSTELKAAAYAGTYVVALAWDTVNGKKPSRKDLLGYAIERAEFDTNGTETERYWLRGIKRFKDRDKGLAPGTPVSRSTCGPRPRAIVQGATAPSGTMSSSIVA